VKPVYCSAHWFCIALINRVLTREEKELAATSIRPELPNARQFSYQGTAMRVTAVKCLSGASNLSKHMNVSLPPFFVLTINDLVASFLLVARFGGIIQCRNVHKDVSLNGLCYIYIHTFIHKYVHTCIYSYAHTHTHTHTPCGLDHPVHGGYG
jgi:hypothetical protein